MTEQEILNEASRIERRRKLVEKLDREFNKRIQLVSFDGPDESARFEVDETCLGFIKSHLVAQFDEQNKPFQKSEQQQTVDALVDEFAEFFERFRKGEGQ